MNSPQPNLPAYLGPAPDGALRLPPSNDEAEQALLGAILANNAAYEKVSDFLRAEHFADAVHARIFEACGKLIERSEEHTSELQSLMRISYAVFCLKKNTNKE